jgi:hypothetical protein
MTIDSITLVGLYTYRGKHTSHAAYSNQRALVTPLFLLHSHSQAHHALSLALIAPSRLSAWPMPLRPSGALGSPLASLGPLHAVNCTAPPQERLPRSRAGTNPQPANRFGRRGQDSPPSQASAPGHAPTAERARANVASTTKSKLVTWPARQGPSGSRGLHNGVQGAREVVSARDGAVERARQQPSHAARAVAAAVEAATMVAAAVRRA